jgi:hypothetical protein
VATATGMATDTATSQVDAGVTGSRDASVSPSPAQV